MVLIYQNLIGNMKNFNICIQVISPVKFDPLVKEMPQRNSRFVFTPSETIYSQNHFISAKDMKQFTDIILIQQSIDRFVKNYNNSRFKYKIHIINIYKGKDSMLLWLNQGYNEYMVNGINKIVENSYTSINVTHYNYKGFYILKDIIIDMMSLPNQFTYFVFHDMDWKDIYNFYYKNNFKLTTSFAEYRKKDHLIHPAHYQLIYFLFLWYGSSNIYRELFKAYNE